MDSYKCYRSATDINERATTTAEKCAFHNNVPNALYLVRTDLASALEDRLAGQVDILIFNPPYVPTTSDEVSA